MELTPQNLAALEGYLRQTLSPDAATRKKAEQFLLGVESQQHFPLLALKLAETHADLQIKVASSILFKNFVKRNWKLTVDGENKIHPQDRLDIKNVIVTLMLSSPPASQKQLSEALSLIAESDFPDQWANLLPELVSKIQPNNPIVMNGVLQTAHSIFKRYRGLNKNDEVLRELVMVLEQFAVPFLELTRVTDRLIQENLTSKENLNLLLPNFFLIAKIYYHLNCIDLPAFFEDNLAEFMAIFLKYLTFDNPLVRSDSEDQAGHLEKIRAAILENVVLFANRYQEEFLEYLPKFVETAWGLLIAVGTEPRNDLLVSTAINFLCSVAKNARHRSLFQAEETLKSICEKIIIPNIEFRESDEEAFEDNPMDYVRKDLEGSDFETRRRAASDFVRVLTQQFEAEVTAIFLSYVNVLLARYLENPRANWKAKDTSVFLVIALVVKSSVQSIGATSTNASVNIVDVFQTNILPSLQSEPNAEMPLLKADAIKFLITFRGQLTKDYLMGVIPLLINHLRAKDTVVKTYAAICIERMLSIRIEKQNVITPLDLKPHLQLLLGNLLEIINVANKTPQQLAENDYVMKTIMRTISASKDEMGPYVEVVLQKLTQAMLVVSKNPSNPKFNHFLFEAVGALVKFISASNPGAVSSFEAMLFPAFQEILQSNIEEFMPYVFQILSQLLELNPKDAISDLYKTILPALMISTLWERQANIPPLVRLLCAFLLKGSSLVISLGKLQDMLGIFQKLIASKSTDHDGFAILNAIVLNIPQETFTPYLKTTFTILLTRLQSGKTTKFVTGFIIFLCTYCAVYQNGALVAFETLESIQPGLSKMVVGSLLIAEAQKVSGVVDRKTCAVGIIMILTQCPTMLLPTHFDSWSMLLVALIKLFELPEEEGEEEDEEEAFANAGLAADEFQATYNQLVFAHRAEVDRVPHITDARALLPKALVALSTSQPGKIGPVIGSLPEDIKATLLRYFAAAQVDIGALR